MKLMQLADYCADSVRRLVRHMDAGMTPSTAYEICFREIDQAYRLCCQLDHVEPVNRMLQAPAVEMQARFALDALFGASKGGCDEAESRKAFWNVFVQATRAAPAASPAPAPAGQ